MSDDARYDIRRKLGLEVEAAYSNYARAAKAFREILSDVPSGLPHPDGALRLEQSGSGSKRALKAFSVALNRYTEFVLNGVVPED